MPSKVRKPETDDGQPRPLTESERALLLLLAHEPGFLHFVPAGSVAPYRILQARGHVRPLARGGTMGQVTVKGLRTVGLIRTGKRDVR